MSKELRYPIFVILFFTILVMMIILSFQKVGPSMNPPRQTLKMDSLQTVFISIKFDDKWLYSEDICSPGMMLNQCNDFDWKELAGFKFPIGKNTLSTFIAEDMSKERAVELFSRLKQLPIELLLFSSPIDSSLSNARKADPSVLFSATLNQFMKWNFFSHLGLSTVYSFKADFIVIDEEVEKILNKQLRDEITRRNIAILYTKPQNHSLLKNEYVLVK